jgi:uncharacterized protein YndB with AHSA1/START domain
MQSEHRITIAATPQTVFRIYEDVSHWHTWDPDTRAASLDGPFQVGTRGQLTPTQGRTVPMELVAVVPDRLFTVESRIPLFRMLFQHELTPGREGTEVVHRVVFAGLLTLLLGPLLAKRLNAGLPVTLARLKSLAESSGRGGPATDRK